jgi:hypothetical protein
MNEKHEPYGGRGHHQGIYCGNEAYAAGHLHGLKVIAHMGHDIASGVPFEKRPVQGQQVAVDPVTDIAFQEARETDNEISPAKTQYRCATGGKNNEGGDQQQSALGRRSGIKDIDCGFQQAGDEQLEKIHAHQGGKSQQEPAAEPGKYRPDNIEDFLCCIPAGSWGTSVALPTQDLPALVRSIS